MARRSSSRWTVLTAVVALTLLVSGLAGGCGLFGGSGGPVSAVDAGGREIKLDQPPDRIISLAPSNTEILFALGLGDRVVGVTSYCNYPAETAAVEKIGDYWSPNYEAIVALEPDIIFAVGTPDSQQVVDLEGYGLSVFLLQAATVEQVAGDIRLIGAVTGATEAAEALAADVSERITSITATLAPVADAERPSVFWVLDSGLWTVGPGSFVHDVITLAGGRNVAADLGQAYAQYSMESLLAADPDVIIVPLLDATLGDALAALEGWDSLRAVQEGRVYQVDPDIVSRPGPRIAEAIETVAGLLYPDLFPAAGN